MIKATIEIILFVATMLVISGGFMAVLSLTTPATITSSGAD